MKLCESCHAEHDGSYGSGRFCSPKCARGFATAAKREEINQKVGITLTGRTYPNRNPSHRDPLSPASRIKQALAIRATCHDRFITWAEDWYKGLTIYTPLPSGRVSSWIKRALILFRGNYCEKCKWAEVNPTTKNVPIQLHHKDGNHENNAPSNLELLCPNCHSLTPNYMALNDSGKPGKRYN